MLSAHIVSSKYIMQTMNYIDMSKPEDDSERMKQRTLDTVWEERFRLTATHTVTNRDRFTSKETKKINKYNRND